MIYGVCLKKYKSCQKFKFKFIPLTHLYILLVVSDNQWYSTVDEKTGVTYYFNEKGETSWKPPPGMEVESEEEEEDASTIIEVFIDLATKYPPREMAAIVLSANGIKQMLTCMNISETRLEAIPLILNIFPFISPKTWQSQGSISLVNCISGCLDIDTGILEMPSNLKALIWMCCRVSMHPKSHKHFASNHFSEKVVQLLQSLSPDILTDDNRVLMTILLCLIPSPASLRVSISQEVDKVRSLCGRGEFLHLIFSTSFPKEEDQNYDQNSYYHVDYSLLFSILQSPFRSSSSLNFVGEIVVGLQNQTFLPPHLILLLLLSPQQQSHPSSTTSTPTSKPQLDSTLFGSLYEMGVERVGAAELLFLFTHLSKDLLNSTSISNLAKISGKLPYLCVFL